MRTSLRDTNDFVYETNIEKKPTVAVFSTTNHHIFDMKKKNQTCN